MTSLRARTHLARLLEPVLALVMIAAVPSLGLAQNASGPAVKAALLFNFAKFAEWPGLAPAAPIGLCVIGDDAIAAALVETIRGQNINGHALETWRPHDGSAWRVCHLLFITEAEARRSAGPLDQIKTLAILTVSDGKNFATTGGIIELYIENDRMRFAINVDTAEHAGLHLSSRLLGLAKVVRNIHVQ